MTVLDTCSLGQTRWAIELGEASTSTGVDLLIHVTHLLASDEVVIPEFMPLSPNCVSPEQGLRTILAERKWAQIVKLSTSERISIQARTVAGVMRDEDARSVFEHSLRRRCVSSWLGEARSTGVVQRHVQNWGRALDEYVAPAAGHAGYSASTTPDWTLFAFCAAVRGLGVWEWAADNYPDAAVSVSPIKQTFLPVTAVAKNSPRRLLPREIITSVLSQSSASERFAKWLDTVEGLRNGVYTEQSLSNDRWTLTYPAQTPRQTAWILDAAELLKSRAAA